MRLPVLLLPIMLVACGDGRNDDQSAVNTPISNAAAPALPAPAQPSQNQEEIENKQDIAEPSGPIPAMLQGRWTGLSDRCGDASAPLELTISPDRLLFHESVGSVMSVNTIDPDQIAIKAAFTGEGESWNRTLTVRSSADGQRLTMVNDGDAVIRKRCS